MHKTELEMDWNTAHKYMSLFLKNPFFLLSFFFFFFFTILVLFTVRKYFSL